MCALLILINYSHSCQERIGLWLGDCRYDFVAAQQFVLYVDNYNPHNIREELQLNHDDMRANKTCMCGILSELSVERIQDLLLVAKNIE